MNSDQRFRKISNWPRRIRGEICNLRLSSRVFWEVQDLMSTNPRIPKVSPLFNQWLATNYAHAFAVGLRRQMDRNKKSVSVAHLLTLLVCEPELVLRDRFVNLYPPDLQNVAHTTFNRHAGNGNIIDPNIPLADLNALDDAFRPLKHYINRRLAHSDIRSADEHKFGELDAFLDLLSRRFAKYLLLFLAQGESTLEATIVSDWKSVFTVPWIASQ